VHLANGGLPTRQALAQALTRLDPPRLGIVEPGRPAIRAGLRPGDLLVRANGDTLPVLERPCSAPCEQSGQSRCASTCCATGTSSR